MSPTKSFSQAQSSQPKRQQTISSFFAPKPSSTPKTVPNPTKSSDENTLRAISNGEQHFPQRSISGSSKRTIDDDESDVENQEPSTKKRRTSPPNTGAEDVDLTHTGNVTKVVATGRDRPAHPSQRTSKYLFSSLVASGEDESASDDDETREYKEHMHERFVKKLGRPDSLIELKRRKRLIPDETAEGDDAAEDAEEEEPEPKPAKGKKPGGARANGQLTPMEIQYLDIKRKHLDTVIVYQVGYKYMFYGEDARVASKELGLVCIPGKFRYDGHPSEAHYSQFASASFPIARLHVHVKRLVNAGHKVGVVKQLETAALKAVGDNRNAPFVRKLTNVYTKGTYVDDTEGLEFPLAAPANGAPATGYLLCLTESNVRGGDNDEKVHVGIVAVQPATGSIIYDEFEDGFMRSEIETRLLHIAPCEYLIVGELSNATNKLIKHLSGSKSNVFGDQARVERVEKPKTMAAQAHSHISNFYADKMQPSGDSTKDEHKSIMLDKLHQLSEHVTICLSAMITHLVEYGLEHIFDLTKNFQSFSARTHMLINGNTLNSLEIYRNQTDHTEKGSLLWTLDHTRTRFGKRLLRNWVGRPLLDKQSLEARTAAVEELIQSERNCETDRLTRVLSSTKPDLERILARVYYKKATRPELLTFLQTLQRIATEFAHVKTASDISFTSTLLRNAIIPIPKIGDTVVAFLDRINLQAAKTDDQYNFLLPAHETAAISSHRAAITATEHALDSYRTTAAQILGKKKVTYESVAGNEYLIEVENSKSALSKVPASWIKVSGTKKVSRFRGPEVVRLMRERDQQREALAGACEEAYATFLGEVGDRYEEFRECILGMAVLDCAMSLAEVARRPGYVKPVFVEDARVEIAKGRHPMVEQLLLDAYVPNDVVLSSVVGLGDPSALLITGPNMGGKSSYVRSVALIAIMAQIGSYVPAESATLGLLDGVFTRMGAFDNMMRGESTFMVELSETADILKQAGKKSLVILDELGRGTSTHDGVAIAEGVLRELVERGVMCCFITHYQGLAKLEGQSGLEGLKNVHVKFHEQKGGNGEDEVTFLYEVGPGVAHRSYG
jgi:DNA mismatch repair protein MSH3